MFFPLKGTLVDLECGSDGCMKGTTPDLEDCEPVSVPPGDPIFGDRNCVKFVRSSAAPTENCIIGRSLLYCRSFHLES